MYPGYGCVVSNFLVQAFQNEPLTIFGDGRQSRSYCYVSDMTDGLIALMSTTEEVAGPINLGNADEITMLELAELIIEQTGSRSRLVFRDSPADDLRQRQPDITLAKLIFCWQPAVSPSEGLVPTIRFL
jgi:UDP-glucuronate decarboxylase